MIYGLESCLEVEMWTDLSSINSAPYCILPCRELHLSISVG